jgi:EspG family
VRPFSSLIDAFPKRKPAMARKDVFIEMTTEEIVVLCEAGGLGLPISLGDEPLGHLPESRVFLAKANATRSLVARRALEVDEAGENRPIEAIRTILEVSSTPGIVGLVTLETVEDEDLDVRTLAVMPELGVELRKVGTNLHRLTPFAPEDLVARIIRLLDLRPAGPVTPLSFTASFDALETCGEAVEEGGAEGIAAGIAALTANGVPAETAQVFVDALTIRRGSAQIAVFHKPTDTTMEGGTLSFIDGGMAGYWQTDAGEEGSGRIATVSTVDASSLARQMLEFLPDAFEGMVPRGLQPLLAKP